MSHFETSPEFAKLVAGSCDIDLVQFMLEIAEDAYPHLDRVGCLMEIDRLGVVCGDHPDWCGAATVRGRLQAVSETLYDIEGFHGNRDEYYEPENSYLNEVLARRCGIPISLGILYMAVAARVGLRMFGVNAPSHFVIGCACGSSALFVDPFNGGDILDRETCKARIEEICGEHGDVTATCLRPAASRDIAARVLRNLKAAYAMRDCWPAVLRVQERLTALLPQIPQERRDLGLVYLRLGKPLKALAVLEPYVQSCGSQQAEALAPSLQAARRMVAELN
ncbi:MAG TPA: transglutaminase-like domain-containing protein [Pirellulales bacterium]|nr:transglutaminase-like domain-containing protein [Pirellulales bacterium]